MAGSLLRRQNPEPSERGCLKVITGFHHEHQAATVIDYAELHCISNFTFLRGASHPEELVRQAAKAGYRAIALTDECSMAGIVRAHVAARELDLRLIVGSEFTLCDGLRCVLLATNRRGYAQLCALITRGRRAAKKGTYRLERADCESGLDGCLALWLPGRPPELDDIRWLSGCFPERAWIAVELLADGNDSQRLAELTRFGLAAGVPLVAAGDVHMHIRGRRALQDTLTAIRLKTTVERAGFGLQPNGERHLRRLVTLADVYPPELLRASLEIIGRIDFSLDELRYEYPRELVPEGHTAITYLRELTEQGMGLRWPEGATRKVSDIVEHELELIAELDYAPFFLTVHDIVRFARSRGILCQGRGSAANSAVCFCLGITEVDPARMSMLVERFISKERDEPPDIDVDFEHERREEVIQYIYGKYGRHRAALAATVISYRPRSAIRDVGRALGLGELQVDRMARAMQWWDGQQIATERVVEAGLDPDSPQIHRLRVLVDQLLGFPRHLSQHVGGFVISEGPLAELVPVENAAMENRTVIQWDKNDLEALGLLKVDVLGLGMLSAIRRSFELIESFYGRRLTMAGVPAEDPVVYDMISAADTMGVFQIESRAQMSMLPRLRPRCYYDLVIEVAIIRPGPIQGDMVHPYLRRRNGEEEVSYPNPEVRAVLERTLGIPIFQEQVMRLAVVAAGFTPGEADQLRRAMAAWKRRGGIDPFEDRLISGMRRRGYTARFARQIFNQIRGFGEYGFPESHAASFALLVYVSAWLKCHEPAVFTCALLNSQPMGFYAPSQLVQMARRHGVEVRPVDVNRSDRDCTLERCADGSPALRLGLRLVNGLSTAGGQRVCAARAVSVFTDVQDMATRAGLDRQDCGALAAADALRQLAGNRHRARWAVAGLEAPLPLLNETRVREGEPMLRQPTEGQDIAADYNHVGLTLRRHPLALLRARFRGVNMLSAEEVHACPDGALIDTAGLVITRQRPGSAKGVFFVTLEDETGHLNLIVWERVAQQQRRALLNSTLLRVSGKVQRQGDVLHVVAQQLDDYSHLLGRLTTQSRSFR
ncbi:MAG: error-prone DNA polymerase [Gammaproteobacteria bacterium]|nr:MAG: error-prone DNA polymerase [Gammaproteobacteria bacterium]